MATAPSGAQHEITAGGYRAVLTQVGGALRSLTHEGRDLVRSFDAGAVRPFYRGSVLAPWPNRVGDGRYTFDGAEQQLPLTEPERGCALHGLVTWLAWEVAAQTPSSVVLGARLWPQAGYPHLLDLRAGYALGDDGLTWTVSATNAGSSRAPYGTSIHPYLVAGEGRVDDWSLELDAARYLEVDPERLLPVGLLPIGLHDVTGTDLDFRAAPSLRGLTVDHALTAVGTGPSLHASATVRAADGAGVAMHWDGAALPWVQVHTADRPEPDADRVALAVEPMTCPPDAFTTGTDLVVLEPGQTHEASWRIEALTP